MNKNAVGVIKSVLTILFCLIFVIIASSIIISKLKHKPLATVFGYGVCFVVTGSMEPTLSVNDVIIVKEIKSPKIDDIVLYKCEDDLVVHRVVNITNNGEVIVTQGDANNTADKPFNRSEIIGKVVGVVPLIGFLITFLKSPYGVIAILSIALIIYIIVYKIIKPLSREK